jgi:N-dimethylarginine dimethylaminohydrolase
MAKKIPRYLAAAFGGDRWSPRLSSHRDEIGVVWESCGINSEWATLKQVLLHRPGLEFLKLNNPESTQMLKVPDQKTIFEQHNDLADKFQELGVHVHYVDPDETPSPNLIFCADLFFMTPEGAILSRPASTVRAGEERWVARRLANLGIPILRNLRGNATFEGADALWIDFETVIIGNGLRTNPEGIKQITSCLNEMGVEVITVDLPVGSMHLMGILRFLDKNLVLTWPFRIAWKAREALEVRGYKVLYIPDENEATRKGALNFVTLGPREIIMADGSPNTQSFLENEGVICHTLSVDEILKAAGGIGCLTGILERNLL